MARRRSARPDLQRRYDALGNLTSKAGAGYTYGTQSAARATGALAKPHAVVAAGAHSY